MLNSEHRVTKSESEWLEIEASVTTTLVRLSLVGEMEGGATATTHHCWTNFVWLLNASGSKTTRTTTSGQVRPLLILHGSENCLDSWKGVRNIEADKFQTILRCFIPQGKPSRAATFADGWRLSCNEVERRSTELTNFSMES